MPISTQWDDPEQKTTILWMIEGAWSWADYSAAEQHAIQLCQGINYPLDHIVDVSQLKLAPADLLTRGRQLYNGKSEFQAGMTVLVGPNRFIESLVNILKQVMPQQFKTFQTAPSIEAAHVLIQQYHVPT